MQATRPARAVASFFRPAPPVAAIARTIENAPALDDEIVCRDGMNRRGKTGIRQAFPASEHTACLIAGRQDRPAPAGGGRAQHGSFGKVEGHVAFQAYGKGCPETGPETQRAALRHRSHGPFQRLCIGARACLIIERNTRHQGEFRSLDKPGTGGGSELQLSKPLRFEDIARIRGEIMQQRHHGRGFASPFGAIRRRQTPCRFGRKEISSAGHGKAKRCRSRRRRDDKGFVHALFSSLVPVRPNPWRTCLTSSGSRIGSLPPLRRQAIVVNRIWQEHRWSYR